MSGLRERSENPLEQTSSSPEQESENGLERSLQDAHQNSPQKDEHANNQRIHHKTD
jgi:hypothetical protein